MQIQYTGEHLFPGTMGEVLIWTGFITAILSTLFYLLSFYRKHEKKRWHRGARGFYFIHAGSMLGVAAVLFYLILNHFFEYSYVWQYSSKTLPLKYIISCFWAGQEGSFLVWALWQALIGVVLVFLAKRWESPVMAIFSLSQVFVTSMLLGVDVAGFAIGSSPFTLLRDTVGPITDTIFSQPNYLSMIEDGNGLNPLLENIWMTIHPPVLFLGYALALVPFSYAIASFMMRDFHTWLGRALPWTLLSITLLGAGILLGGAWAYVSLTFGGFWSWDPVENSSLVPWMTLVAALHFILIARRQNFALLAAYVFTGLSYVLVLYASFLTRSGVLSDTSAHSFGDNGMTAQLLVFMLTFLVLLIVFIAMNVRKFHVKRKEILLSREFWMFLGAVVVTLAAFQVILTTSVPVINAVFGTTFAPPADPVQFYNRWQMPFALLIAGIIAVSQFLNYNENSPAKMGRKMVLPLVVTLALYIPFFLLDIVTRLDLLLFFFFILFALIASLTNMMFQTSRPRNTAAIITHIGFALFLMGAVLTFSNSKVISANTSPYDLGSNEANAENLLLMRSDTLYMEGFYVTYVKSSKEGNFTTYQVDFLKKNGSNYHKEFTLLPTINVHPRMGAVYNPATRHFLNRDYYTYIATAGGEERDYIVIKAIMNPYINILWLGSIVMIAGFGYSFVKRARRRWISNT